MKDWRKDKLAQINYQQYVALNIMIILLFAWSAYALHTERSEYLETQEFCSNYTQYVAYYNSQLNNISNYRKNVPVGWVNTPLDT